MTAEKQRFSTDIAIEDLSKSWMMWDGVGCVNFCNAAKVKSKFFPFSE